MGGVSFAQRLQNFQNHVQTTYAIHIAANSEFGTAERQSRWHIAHMIRFNSYATLRPAQSEVVQGRNVIAFNHLSNAALAWGAGVDYTHYLRDQMNMACRKSPDGRQWVNALQTRALGRKPCWLSGALELHAMPTACRLAQPTVLKLLPGLPAASSPVDVAVADPITWPAWPLIWIALDSICSSNDLARQPMLHLLPCYFSSVCIGRFVASRGTSKPRNAQSEQK